MRADLSCARCWLQDAGCKKTEFIASPVYPEGCCRWAVTSKLFSKRKLHIKFDYWGAKKSEATWILLVAGNSTNLACWKLECFFFAINLVNFWLLQEILTELWKPIWRFKHEEVVTQQSYESHVSQSYERDHENSVSDTQRQRGSYLKYEEAVIQRSHGICIACRETQRVHGSHSITGIVTQRYHGNSATDTQRQHGFYLKYEEVVTQRSHGICGRETQRAHGCHSITGIVTQRYHGNSATDTQRQHGSY